MKRNQLVSLLNAYAPTDAAELRCKEQMLQFINDHPDCFERSLAVGHITASAWLLNRDHTHALLMHHTKLQRWIQLGGHCDGESDVLAVAIKEAQEESGIMAIEPVNSALFDIDIHRIPANPREAEHDHYDVRFLLAVTSDEQIVQNRESMGLRWFGKQDTLPTDNWSVVRMMQKWGGLVPMQRVEDEHSVRRNL